MRIVASKYGLELTDILVPKMLFAKRDIAERMMTDGLACMTDASMQFDIVKQ